MHEQFAENYVIFKGVDLAREDTKSEIKRIEKLISKGDFTAAAAEADRIDWNRTGTTGMLCRLSDVYKLLRRYEDSRDLLEIAHERNPSGVKIIYSLCELELKMGNLLQAIRYYNQFESVSPNNPDRHILRYKLMKTQDASMEELIEVLEELRSEDLREKWAYELAKLYALSDRNAECISVCDEIIAFFGDGNYVIKSLELKGALTELTDREYERYTFLKNGGTLLQQSEEENNPDEAESEYYDDNEEPEASEYYDDGEEPEASEYYDDDEEPETSEYYDDDEEPETSEYYDDGEGPEASEYYDDDEESETSEYYDDDEPESSEYYDDNEGSEPSAGKNAAEQNYEDEEPEVIYPDVVENISESEYLREMEETVARGLRDLDDYDSVLTQETDGQYTMVMQETSIPETQITGQLDFNEIMKEWEKVRRDNEQIKANAYETNNLTDEKTGETGGTSFSEPAQRIGRAIREGFEEYMDTDSAEAGKITVKPQKLSEVDLLGDTKEFDARAIIDAIMEGKHRE